MRITNNKATTFSFSPLLFLFFSILFSVHLQAQTQQVPNISTDEFTEKGMNSGWEEGATVPNVAFNDINNKKFKLHDLLDKHLIIELYDLNCHTCAKNKKYLKSFYKQFNINILGICPDDYPNEIRKLSRKQQLEWSTVYDDSRKLLGQSFADSHQLGDAKFILINPDKTIEKIFYSEREIGKLGVALQSKFR